MGGSPVGSRVLINATIFTDDNATPRPQATDTQAAHHEVQLVYKSTSQNYPEKLPELEEAPHPVVNKAVPRGGRHSFTQSIGWSHDEVACQGLDRSELMEEKLRAFEQQVNREAPNERDGDRKGDQPRRSG